MVVSFLYFGVICVGVFVVYTRGVHIRTTEGWDILDQYLESARSSNIMAILTPSVNQS